MMRVKLPAIFACQTIQSTIAAGESLEKAIMAAHRAIKTAPLNGVGRPGMATTVVAVLVHDNEYQVSWVGDSRAYLWRDAALSQISHDQSLVQRLVDENVISEEEAQNHPRRNLVIQALGQENLDDVEVETVRAPFNDGDELLLCSDGLSDYLTDDDIAAYLAASDNVDAAVKVLIDAALKTEGKDNITALAIKLSAQTLAETQLIDAVKIRAVMTRQRLTTMAWLAVPVMVIALFYLLQG